MTNSKLQIVYEDPAILKPNPWNPNKVDPINQQKLINSMKKVELFKPILVRTLEDNTLEIIGGEHRASAAMSLGKSEVPVLNLGKISDKRAKEITLLDNSQYGELDHDKFVDLIGEGELGDTESLLSYLPIDESELLNIFDHSLEEIDGLEMDYDDDPDDSIDIEPPTTTKPTSQILRFKVPATDAHIVTDFINKVKDEQGFGDSDELTNAGDALIYAVKELLNENV